MIKKFMGSLSLLTLLFCGPIFAEQQPNPAEIRSMLDEQVRTAKAQIEEQTMEKQYKVYGNMSMSFALASITGLFAADAIIKMAKGDMNPRDMVAAIVSSGASLWALLNVLNCARRLGKLSADQEEKLQELEETARKLRHEVLQMERQARAEAEKKQSAQKIDTTEIEQCDWCGTKMASEEPVKPEEPVVATVQPVDESDAKS